MEIKEHIQRIEAETQKLEDDGHSTVRGHAELWIAYQDIVIALSRFKTVVKGLNNAGS